MISLLSFVRTGRLGDVGLGSTRKEVEKVFGAPDDWGQSVDLFKAPIWKYGRVEIHFSAKGIFLIFCDDFTAPDGAVFAFDFSELGEGTEVDVEAWLRHHEISFQKAAFPWCENGVLFHTDSGVDLKLCADKTTFANESNIACLCSVSCLRR